MKYIFLLLALVGCASKTPASVETRGETTMQELVMDGETGLVSSGVAKQYYDRHGIMFVPRAK